ncbi:MAG TPA: FecR domain-containing protein [Xanthomonadales bacterium]|nr:FecR domain-containing protein [Xanthomonadales bacterium]
MNGTEHDKGRTQRSQENDVLAELFRHASARQRPPPGDEQAIRDALQAQWEDMTLRSRRGRKSWVWGIAASLMLAAVLGVLLQSRFSASQLPSPLAVASIVKGNITRSEGSDSGAQQVRENEKLTSGQSLRTTAGSRLGLTWSSGVSIGLDEFTELRLVSNQEVFLVQGRVYMDFPPGAPTENSLAITSEQGLIKHHGTQFMTQLSTAGLAISVREGEVAFLPSQSDQKDPLLAGVGQQLSVSTGGEISVREIPTWGQEWAWTESLSVGFDSDGRSVAELLAWAGRETGRKVQYTSVEARSAAQSALLHGKLEIEPGQAIAVVTATSDLRARMENGHIVVRLARSD